MSFLTAANPSDPANEADDCIADPDHDGGDHDKRRHQDQRPPLSRLVRRQLQDPPHELHRSGLLVFVAGSKAKGNLK